MASYYLQVVIVHISYFNWLYDQGSEKLVCPQGDLITFFDNIGRYVIKNYRVHSAKTRSAAIISTVMHINLDQMRLQDQEELKPIYWGANRKEEEIQAEMLKYIKINEAKFRKL